jgi:hypothetical protein
MHSKSAIILSAGVLLASFCGGAQRLQAGESRPPAMRADFYVSPQGNDAWSGGQAEPNAARTDGPLATVRRAQQLVREWKQHSDRTGPIVVAIRGGTYYLSQPLRFGPADSGTPQAPVVYAAYEQERPILSGGVQLAGWQVAADGRWQKVLEEVKGGKWSFAQLFVNDQWWFRPRLPVHGYYKIARELPPAEKAGRKWHAQLAYSGDDLRADWANRGDVEVQVFRGWTAMRLGIAAIDPAQHVVTFRAAGQTPEDLGAFPKDERFLLDNVREALAAPGQWYLNRPSGELTYIPMPGKQPDKSVVIAPRLERLLVIEGDPTARRWAEHLQFRGLTFAHANWTMPEGGQTCGQAETNLDGALSVIGGRNLVLAGCAVRHVGTYAMAFGEGCRDNLVENCEMLDMGAGGVKIGHAGSGPLYG